MQKKKMKNPKRTLLMPIKLKIQKKKQVYI